MKRKRIIARLDVKGENVVKGVQMECLRVMGNPGNLAEKYYAQGADEILYLDTVANLYRRDNLINIVDSTTNNLNIPVTVGGGVRTIDDIHKLLNAGADKVAINTAATKNPLLIRESSEIFGSQCIVLSIEAKRKEEGKWEAYTNNGREKTGLDVIGWAKKGQELGAGEILITSVDQDGTEKGFDYELIKAVTNAVSIPVMASGGAGSVADVKKCIQYGNPDAVAIGSILHYKKEGIDEIKQFLSKSGIPVRRIPNAKKAEVTDYEFTNNYNYFTLSHLKNKTNNQISEKEEEFERIPDAPLIGIIDYGINNVKSVLKAFQRIKKRVAVVSTVAEIKSADYLVLPGVGAFKKGMKALEERKFVEVILSKAEMGTPLLGICLGMQLLFTESEEFGLHKGLNIIRGGIVKLKSCEEVEEQNYKVPHIGWNDIGIPSFCNDSKLWERTVLSSIENHSSAYFVHSFYPRTENLNYCIATTVYGKQEFCSVIQKENIIGTQFHPEKSGEMGLKILESFSMLKTRK